METFFLVKRDGSLHVEDGRSLFTLEEANERADGSNGLAIAPGFILPDPS